MKFHALAPRRYKRSVVSGFVHRIYRACSSWQYICDSIDKAKEVHEKNQYPVLFYEPIIAETINKLREPPQVSQNTATNADDSQENHRLLLQYRGQPTDQFVKQLKSCGAPAQVILTLRKLKTEDPTLGSRKLLTRTAKKWQAVRGQHFIDKNAISSSSDHF